MSKLVANEQAKLSATYFNALAVAVLAVGVFAPIAALVTGSVAMAQLLQLVALIGCMLVSGALHFLGRQVLEGLVE